MSYRAPFDKISVLTHHQTRGNEFEKLINKIFEDKGLLITSRYRTTDGQQEIDGAILIHSRIFLIESKWESSSTLAASKLYSFLGKINSKIDGTLGIFISYNELSENFIDSVRNGIRQNCILIHGPNNIADIIDEKVNLKDYLEYSFIQASIKNKVEVSTSEFIAVPIKTVAAQASNALLGNNWLEIYDSLIGYDTLATFTAKLETLYSPDLELSKKAINIYTTLIFDSLISEKFEKLIEKLVLEEKASFSHYYADKVKGNKWQEYADEYLYDILKPSRMALSEEDGFTIISNVTPVLNAGNWVKENLASYILDIFYSSLTPGHKEVLAQKYLEIYVDSNRSELFQQKQFANKLFAELKRRTNGYFELVKTEIITAIEVYKIDEYYETKLGDEARKELSIRRTEHKYAKVFEDNNINAREFIEAEYDNI